MIDGNWGHRLLMTVSRASDRLFRERQLIVRSHDGLRCFRLSRRWQQGLALAALLLVILPVAAGVAMQWQQQRLLAERQDRLRAEDRQADLASRIDDVRSSLATVAEEIDPEPEPSRAVAAESGELSKVLQRLKQAVGRLKTRNAGLSEEVARLRQGAAETERRLLELAGQRAKFEAQLQAATQSLEDLSMNRSELHERLAGLRRELATSNGAVQTAEQGRLEAERQREALERRNSEIETEKLALQDEVMRIRAELEDTQATRSDLLRERESLAQKVARLERALGTGEHASGGSLGDRIAGLERALLAAERRGDGLAADRDRLSQRVGELEGQLSALQERQSGIFEQFSVRAVYGLEAIEKTVEMTGLDVDRLVARVRAERGGVGGPFIPAELDMEVPAALREDVERLDRQMHRLVALRTALRSLPLSAPLDSYWVSSQFGKRKDPYNGRWATHEGLDLAANLGTPVHATAPGIVIFAGWRGRYGRLVEVDHGFGLKTRYGHLQSVSVKAGQRIQYRERLGGLGSSGRSTGPHVHYEILLDGKAIDPMNFLKAGKHVFKS